MLVFYFYCFVLPFCFLFARDHRADGSLPLKSSALPGNETESHKVQSAAPSICPVASCLRATLLNARQKYFEGF
jgi:hypothetical protein